MTKMFPNSLRGVAASAAMLAFFLSSIVHASSFSSQLDLSPLETLTVQHNQTLKTLDTYARQTLTTITGRSKLKDSSDSALFTVFDICFRPEQYASKNLIKIRHVPLRQDFRLLDSISEVEKDRIVKEGTISLEFWQSEPVQKLMMDLQSSAVHKAEAVQQLHGAAATLQMICRRQPDFLPVAMIVPATNNPDDHRWHMLGQIVGNIPSLVESLQQQGMTPPPPLPNFQGREPIFGKIVDAAFDLMNGWRDQDAAKANAGIKVLADLFPQVNPAVYPSQMRRNVEVVYNRLAKLTIPGAAFYFAAFVCFLMSARSGVAGLRLWGLRLFTIGLLIHTAGIGIRWWLVAAQHGSWFDGIPIKNQFESVLMSAFFGAIVGYILELRRSRGIFGAAASFVGWMSLIAIFATPYVAGRDIGGEIGQVAGVLMSYWLYIHVTLVTASYALIGMAFLLSIWWLVRYYMEYRTLRRVPARQLSSDASGGLDAMVSAGPGTAAIGFARTLADVLFMPRARAQRVAKVETQTKTGSFLATLDLCNLVVLQLAFWVLGLGIICGAIWADQSWGRPWGWDPKETFALVTWIVYLVVVHVRVATEDKAWWTAVLSIVGFFVMLFNWVGVNFFLVGLHSYA